MILRDTVHTLNSGPFWQRFATAISALFYGKADILAQTLPYLTDSLP